MSARKLDSSGVFEPAKHGKGETQFTLPEQAYQLSKSGIEFYSTTPVSEWSEMTIELESPLNGAKIRCNGVVVGCHGNRHTGYSVSLIFMSLSPQSEARLSALAARA